MTEKKIHIIEVGSGGRIQLPKEVMKAIDVVPGNQIKIEVGTGHASMTRHLVKDPFAEAAKKKKHDIKDLMAQQEARKKEAARLFEKGVKEKHEIRPEDREDFWR